ncbi:MAG TPA: iron-sulfur cluster assembly accessory protein [Polyangiaceae bacterium]|nr:iron-sulfur cluster assembly accessory protein [Polyangiaceae bacterium]
MTSADMTAEAKVTEQPKKAEQAPAPPNAPSNAPSKRMIAVSQKAVDAMRAQIDKRQTPNAAIRVGLRGGGCSGFSYVIEFDDNPPRPGDLVLEFPEEGKSTVRVFCDKKSIIYLGGSVLDWEKTLMFQGFKFKNPNEASSCGCGHSFNV